MFYGLAFFMLTIIREKDFFWDAEILGDPASILPTM